MDEAQSIGGAVYYPHRVDVLGQTADFSMHIDAAQLGPVTMGWLSYDTEVQVGTAALTTAYHVNVPVRGELKTGSGIDRMIATSTRAAVYRCDRPTVMRGWRDDRCRMLAVKIARPALEEHLSTLLNRPVEGPIQFALPMDLTEVRAQQWWAFLRDLADHVGDPDALARHPMMAASLAGSVMTGLLLATRHNYRDELDADALPARPATIQRAVEYIEEHLTDPLDVATIAKHVRLSVRSLQEGFQNSLGTTPMRYVRDLRLRQARRDLVAAETGSDGVAQIAMRWGFTHLGRFAGQYRDAFGESPSEALHGSRTTVDTLDVTHM
ncbi:helix-turn-helix domain-containing protein [Mycolicibacterium neoaurum]|uniref:AraC-like ligand-binding domain-containing protein n=1 Tax=Mycolicibacterium neoaurum TaxID=1795 RepID=UPI001F29FD78|nr:AraC family transcriptional regulator [Mycolicibacterium neoaurum]